MFNTGYMDGRVSLLPRPPRVADSYVFNSVSKVLRNNCFLAHPCKASRR
jgi:hypothetical protein